MVRTVGVKVLADSAQYERAMAKSGLSTDQLADEMQKAAKTAEKLAAANLAVRTATLEAAKASDSAARAQDRAATAAERAAKANVAAGAAAEDAAEAAKKLERGEITEAEAKKVAAKAARANRTAQLADAEAQRLAADAAQKLEHASIKAGAAQLAQATAARKAAEELRKAGQKSGKGFFAGLVDEFGQAGSVLGEYLTPVLVGAALGAAPFAAAGLGGGIIAGLGAAGIGAAIAGQIDSPRVRSAFGQLADDAKRELQDVSSSFEEPLAHTAAIFAHGLRLESNDLQTMLDNVAPEVEALAQGFTDLILNASTALPGLSEKFKPILNVIANDLPRLGLAIGDFLDDVSSDADGAAEGVAVAIALIAGGIRAAGKVIALAESGVDGFFDKIRAGLAILAAIPNPLQGKAREWLAAMNRTFDTSHHAADGVEDYADATADATTNTKAFNDALKSASDQFDSLVNSAIAASNADLAFRDALAGITDAVDENGTSLDANTDKGRKNIAMLTDLVSKAEQERQANIANGMSVEDANKKFDQQVAAIYKQAAAAGYSKERIDALLRSLGLIPGKKEFNVYAKGADGALSLLKSIHYYLDSLHNKQFTVTTYYQTKGGQGVRGSSSIGGGGRAEADGGIVDFRAYADGGFSDPAHVAQIVPAGSYRLFGETETGGEAYIPLAASKRGRSLSIWEEAGRRMGVMPALAAASVPAVTVAPSFNVQVLMGTRDITDLVDLRITEANRGIYRGATAGRRR